MRNRGTKPKAMRVLTLPGCDVKKANELVRSRISITDAIGSRILASLIACVRTDDTEFRDVYEIQVKDFITDAGGKSYIELKKLCRKLGGAVAETETLKDGKPHFSVVPFFERLDYHDGVVKARFNAGMAPMLIGLQRCFTEYNLFDYLKLPSVYSQRIFEILKSWDDKPEVIISLPELHRMLTSPASFQANFAEFRRRVLEKAHKDITEKTPLRYEWEPVKKGKAVTAVRFIFGRRLAIAAQTSDQAKKQKKQAKVSATNNADFLKYTACLKDRGPACEGGHQKESVCKLCKTFR